MVQWIKIAGLSAVLAASAVTAFGDTGRAATASGKVFHDRLPSSSDIPVLQPDTRSLGAAPVASARGMTSGKGDRVIARANADCAAQAWPYVAAQCLTPVGEVRAPRPVRTITVETREGANTSVLVRLPQTTVAAR